MFADQAPIVLASSFVQGSQKNKPQVTPCMPAESYEGPFLYFGPGWRGSAGRGVWGALKVLWLLLAVRSARFLMQSGR